MLPLDGVMLEPAATYELFAFRSRNVGGVARDEGSGRQAAPAAKENASRVAARGRRRASSQRPGPLPTRLTPAAPAIDSKTAVAADSSSSDRGVGSGGPPKPIAPAVPVEPVATAGPLQTPLRRTSRCHHRR